MVKLVGNGCGTVALHRSVEQDQEIPIGVRLRITPGTGPVEDNARGWIESLERIAETLQENVITIGHAAMLHTCAISVSVAQSPVSGPAEYRLLSCASSKSLLARVYLCLDSVRWRAPVSWAFSPHSRSLKTKPPQTAVPLPPHMLPGPLPFQRPGVHIRRMPATGC